IPVLRHALFSSQEPLDVLHHPLFGDCADKFRNDDSVLINDESFRNAVNAEINADLASQIHAIGECLAELPDKLPGWGLPVLDVRTNHHDAAFSVKLPPPLQSWCFLITSGVAPRGPEIYDHDLAAQRTRIKCPTGEERKPEIRHRSPDERRGDRPGISSETEREHTDYGNGNSDHEGQNVELRCGAMIFGRWHRRHGRPELTAGLSGYGAPVRPYLPFRESLQRTSIGSYRSCR